MRCDDVDGCGRSRSEVFEDRFRQFDFGPAIAVDLEAIRDQNDSIMALIMGQLTWM